VARCPAGATATRSAESVDLAWFPLDALPDPHDAALERMAALARRRLRAT
jgi:hypothetical protein